MLLLKADRIPNIIKLERRDDPPYDTNGNVTPTIGMSPMFIPTFTKNCIEMREKHAVVNTFPKGSSSKRKML